MVVERGAGMNSMMRERDLEQAGELRQKSNFGKGQMVAADYTVSPTLIFQDNDMGGVGGAVGGLFAAFSFAISVFAIPMQLDKRVDALTAMGSSMALVWNNLPVMLTWGAIVLALTLIGIATGLVGLIVIFPLLGHGTWHCYKAIR